MCQQLDILEKIREKGKVNGYDIDLAEAQARDYIRMDKKVGKIEKDMSLMKKDIRKLLGRLYNSEFSYRLKKNARMLSFGGN